MDLEERWRRQFRIDLETPRSLLRPLAPEDAAWISELCADPEVNRFLWECAAAAEEARRAAEAIVYLDLHQCHFGHWAIHDKAAPIVHGWVELSKLRPWSDPSDEIAISYVLRRASWGRGIATEAAVRLLRHAFDVNRLGRVMAVIMAENTASGRVLEKLGMEALKTSDSTDGRKLQYFRIDAPATPSHPPSSDRS